MQAALGSPNGKASSEVSMLREELKQSQASLVQWHESWKQAKQACDAWKKEAEEASTKARLEREDAIRRIEELELALRESDNKMRIVQAQGPIRALAENAELARLPMSNLEQIQQLIRRDLERVEAVSLNLSVARRDSGKVLSMLKNFPPLLDLGTLTSFFSVPCSTEHSAQIVAALHPV